MSSASTSLLSLTCDDSDPGPLTNETRWRGRSIGYELERSANGDDDPALTLSLRFTASELDLVGMGLQCIPISAPCRQSHQTGDEMSRSPSTVHRVIKLRVGSMAALKKSTRRQATLCTILGILSTAGAAMVGNILVPRMIHKTRLADGVQRAAVMDRAKPWASDERSDILFVPTHHIQGAFSAASRSLSHLSMQLSPLSAAPLHAPPEYVPETPVAIMGLAAAVTEVLASLKEVREPSERTNQSTIGSMLSNDLIDLDAPAAFSSTVKDIDLNAAVTMAQLCGFAYHSCDCKDREAHVTAKLAAEMQEQGLELVREIHGAADEYAYVAHDPTSRKVVIAFRGSCTVKNLITDLAYRGQIDGTDAVEALAEATGMVLPDGMQLHRGFCEAYLALRAPILAALDEIDEIHASAGGTKPLHVQVTGHSMGGAVGMLAALELAHLRRTGARPLGVISTYTFAAPRLGNSHFAELFQRTFPSADEHWSLQVPSDAVPHLPFAAWGFCHPKGVAVLDEKAIRLAAKARELTAQVHHATGATDLPIGTAGSRLDDSETPLTKPPRAPLHRSTDRGDQLADMQPRDGDLKNWAMCHDLSEYLSALHELGGGVASPLTPKAVCGG